MTSVALPKILRGDIKLKVNFQKILAVFLSVFIVVSCFSLSVFADVDLSYEANKDTQNILYATSHLKSLINDYYNGNISASEFLSQSSQDFVVIGVSGFDIASFNGFQEALCYIAKNSSNLEALGLPDYFDDYVHTRSVHRNEFDMHGYGAALYIADKGGHKYEVTYMNYGILKPYSDYYNCHTNGASLEIICSYSDVITERVRSGDFSTRYTSKCILYGDWRYEDGTSATDYIKDNPTIYPTLDNPQDVDFNDFFDKFLEKLNFEFPDLSTIEGLLTALLNKLGTLDSDDDTGAINAVNQSIQSLSALNTANTNRIIAALENRTSDLSTFDYDELIDTLNAWLIDDSYNEISSLELVKNKFDKKTSFITELKSLCNQVMTSYKNGSDNFNYDFYINGHLQNLNFDFFADYMPIVRMLLCVYIYISFAWRTFRKVPAYISGVGDDN